MEYLGTNKLVNRIQPVVSVCVQTYQHSAFIRDCLDSILMQKTDFPFEIILGEDESTDGTRGICKKYAGNNPDKIRLFLRSRKDVIYINGQATGRYNLIENLNSAKGKYIAMCEGDDYWTDPLKLQKQVDILEKNPTLIGCHHWQEYRYDNNNDTYELKPAPKIKQGYLPKEISTVKEIFANEMRVKTRTVMYRNIMDKNFFPSWFYKVAFGDVPLSFLMGKHGDFAFIDESMAVYRQTVNGVSSHDRGTYLRFFIHYTNWISIWEYGIKENNFNYWDEARSTIVSFYLQILNHYEYSNRMIVKLFTFNLIESRLGLLKRFSVLRYITSYVINRKLLSLKKKVKRKLLSNV